MEALKNKYQREISPGILVDVYDVLNAFEVTCPARAHAIKKLLATGKRGHKDEQTDLREAVDSIKRSLVLLNKNQDLQNNSVQKNWEQPIGRSK